MSNGLEMGQKLAGAKTGKTDRAEVNSGTLPSCHHHQPKPILSSKKKTCLMPFTAATGRARGPETELTPPNLEQPQPLWVGTRTRWRVYVAGLEG